MPGIPNNKKIWETRRKNGTDSSWNKGLHHSLETRAKIKEARKKQIFTEETRKKLSLAHKGKVISTETRFKMSEALKGEKCYLWRGGTHNLTKIIRNDFRYRQWRSDCFTRDNYICQNCDQKGYNLQVDHIKPLSYILEDNQIKSLEDALNCEELWNINNGRTLCIDCHKKTDTWGSNSRISNRKIRQ